MDSADAENMRAALRAQGARIHSYEERLTSLVLEIQGMASQQQNFQTLASEQLRSLTGAVQQLSGRMVDPAADASGSSIQTAAAPPSSTPSPVPLSVPTLPHAPALQLSSPTRFSGDSDNCRSFLVQCGLHFELHAAAYPTDRAKVAYIISHLSGRAEAWATAEWARNSLVCHSLDSFKDMLSKIFDHTTPGRESARALMGLRQAKRRVSDYAIEFCTLAADSGWNPAPLCDAFLHGLADRIKDQLTPLELPEDLDSLISLAVKIDNRLFERERERSKSSGYSSAYRGQSSAASSWRPPPPLEGSRASAPPAVQEEPMQLGRTRLDPEERRRRMQEGRCVYCSQLGHFIASCPVKDRAHP